MSEVPLYCRLQLGGTSWSYWTDVSLRDPLLKAGGRQQSVVCLGGSTTSGTASNRPSCLTNLSGTSPLHKSSLPTTSLPASHAPRYGFTDPGKGEGGKERESVRARTMMVSGGRGGTNLGTHLSGVSTSRASIPNPC
jgi:hypothetical protein